MIQITKLGTFRVRAGRHGPSDGNIAANTFHSTMSGLCLTSRLNSGSNQASRRREAGSIAKACEVQRLQDEIMTLSWKQSTASTAERSSTGLPTSALRRPDLDGWNGTSAKLNAKGKDLMADTPFDGISRLRDGPGEKPCGFDAEICWGRRGWCFGGQQRGIQRTSFQVLPKDQSLSKDMMGQSRRVNEVSGTAFLRVVKARACSDAAPATVRGPMDRKASTAIPVLPRTPGLSQSSRCFHSHLAYQEASKRVWSPRRMEATKHPSVSPEDGSCSTG